jgi:hypothetical protein
MRGPPLAMLLESLDPHFKILANIELPPHLEFQPVYIYELDIKWIQFNGITINVIFTTVPGVLTGVLNID